jgi:hypothetical protein
VDVGPGDRPAADGIQDAFRDGPLAPRVWTATLAGFTSSRTPGWSFEIVTRSANSWRCNSIISGASRWMKPRSNSEPWLPSEVHLARQAGERGQVA